MINLDQKNNIMRLLENLSSFVMKNLPDDSSYEGWLGGTLESFEMFKASVNAVSDNTNIETAHTLRTVPYFEIDIEKAIYSTEEARLYSFLGEEELVESLFSNGYYIDLEFWEFKTRQPLVYAMDLYTDFQKTYKLQLRKEYFIRRNRLYILPQYILENTIRTNKMHAFNIKVNDYILEKNWGINVPLEVPLLIPRYQYRNLMFAYNKLMQSDFFIKDIIEAIEKASEFEDIEIFDACSRNLPEHLKELYTSNKLSPADFIVRLKEMALPEKIQINIILHILENARESQTYFWLFFYLVRIEIFEPDDESTKKVMYKKADILYPEDEQNPSGNLEREDFLFYQSVYDTDLDYDTSKQFDKPGQLDNGFVEKVIMDNGHLMDQDILMDLGRPHYIEQYVVNVRTYPEIPREFNVINNSIEMLRKDDFHEFVDVYGSANGTVFKKVFEFKLEELPVGKISVPIPDEIAAEMKYYKVKARDGRWESLFSLVKGG